MTTVAPRTRISVALCLFGISLGLLAALVYCTKRNQPNQYLADAGWAQILGSPKKSLMQGTYRPVIGMRKDGGGVTDNDWRALADLPVITRLVISNAKVDYLGGYAVTTFSRLRTLSLLNCTIEETNFQTTPQWKNITSLSLAGESLASVLPDILDSMPQLTTLSIVQMHVSDGMLKDIVEMRTLDGLLFGDQIKVTTTLSSLGLSRSLRYLNLSGCIVNEEELRAIVVAPQIEVIVIRENCIAEKTIEEIQRMNSKIRLVIADQPGQHLAGPQDHRRPRHLD
jgi:hypothetical protein